MKILEIGGGTGSVTELLAKTLALGGDKGEPRCGHLDYTDASSDNVEKAQAKFAPEAEIMGFKVLDINQDPEMQGLECGTYDMVVASQVCSLLAWFVSFADIALQLSHETSTLKATLQNARKLLKP
jgi:SAM-dependent methyltransferase